MESRFPPPKWYQLRPQCFFAPNWNTFFQKKNTHTPSPNNINWWHTNWNPQCFFAPNWNPFCQKNTDPHPPTISIDGSLRVCSSIISKQMYWNQTHLQQTFLHCVGVCHQILKNIIQNSWRLIDINLILKILILRSSWTWVEKTDRQNKEPLHITLALWSLFIDYVGKSRHEKMLRIT